MGKSFAIRSHGRDILAADTTSGAASTRPFVRGKFLYRGEEKLYIRGVTYGPFAPGEDREGGFLPSAVDADFADMARSEIGRASCRERV